MNLSQAANQFGSLWRLSALIFIVAVPINYVWEITQAPLYVGMDSFNLVRWCCGLASLGDGLLVLLIYGAGWAVLRRWDWFIQPRMKGYGLMAVVGLVIAVAIEWVAVFLADLWTYKPTMPVVPVLALGFTPVAQMLLLPPLIFRLVAIWLTRACRTKGQSDLSNRHLVIR